MDRKLSRRRSLRKMAEWFVFGIAVSQAAIAAIESVPGRVAVMSLASVACFIAIALGAEDR